MAVYALCLQQSGTEAIPAELLFRSGAMYSGAIERGEHWRLVAYGFLHANLFHIATNMLCLALWGGHLEKRAGSFYFILIYVCALIGGAIVGRYTHPGPYLTVGASGGISGILGALLCLWVLGKIEVAASFFVVNIGLNVALAFGIKNVDWGAHVGGFAVGLIACASINLIEKANARVMRCKFPEFIKVNALIIVGGVALLAAAARPIAVLGADGRWLLTGFAVAGCLAVKACDLVLSIRRGLAIVVLAFALANAGFVWLAGAAWTIRSACPFHTLPLIGAIRGAVVDAACADMGSTLVAAAAGAGALTLLVYARELSRGLKDRGFVAGNLRAERKRHDWL